MRLLLLNLPQIHADLTISMISVSEIPPFWDIPDVTEVQCLEVFGVFFGDLPGASIWQKLPHHFGTGGASKKKWVVFGVFWGEGQMIQISLNSTDGNLDSNYMYIIFACIYTYTKNI